MNSVSISDALKFYRANPAMTLVNILDTSANISKNFDALNLLVLAGKVNQINQLAPLTPLLITYKQLSDDGLTLSKILNPYTLNVTDVLVNQVKTVISNTHVTKIAVSDFSSSILGNLSSLQALGTKLSTITFYDPAPVMTVPAATYLANQSTLNKIISPYSVIVSGLATNSITKVLTDTHVGSVTVVDSSSNIAANLSSLQALGSKLESISISPGTSTSIALTQNQYLSNLGILNTIKGTYSLVVSGVTSSNLNTILGDNRIGTFTFNDASANIASVLDTLQNNIAKVVSITQSGLVTPLNISNSQLIKDAAILAKISNPYTLTVSEVGIANLTTVFSNLHVKTISILDSSENIAKNIETLQALGLKLISVALSGTISPMALTYTQFISNAITINKISGSYLLAISKVTVKNTFILASNQHVTYINVEDSSGNIATNLKALNDLGASVKSITQSGTIASMKLTAVTVGNVQNIFSKFTNTYSIDVVDTSVNIAANLDALQAIVNNLLSIRLSETLTPIQLTLGKFFNDQMALSKIVGNYAIKIFDSPINLSAAIDKLHGNLGKIVEITLTDPLQTLNLSKFQLSTNTDVLAKIGTYKIKVLDAQVADITSLLSNPHVSELKLSGFSVDIVNKLDIIHANLSKISNIVQIDSNNPLNMTELQYINNVDIFAKFEAYSLNLTNVVAVDGVNLANNFHVSSISIVDNSNNISTYLDSLKSVGNKILSVTISDHKPLIISVEQALNDFDLIVKLSNSQPIAISDFTNNIVKNLDELEALFKAGYLSSIALLDTDIPNISLTVKQFFDDQDVLVLMAKNEILNHPLFKLHFNNGETLNASQAASIDFTLLQNFDQNSLVVKDSSINVDHYLNQLDALASNPLISLVQLTDQPTEDLYLNAINLNIFKFIKGPLGHSLFINSQIDDSLNLEGILNAALDGLVSKVNLEFKIENWLPRLALMNEWDLISKAWDAGLISNLDFTYYGEKVTKIIPGIGGLDLVGFFSNSHVGLPSFDFLTHIQGMRYFAISMDGWGLGYDNFAAKAKLIDSYDFHGTDLWLSVNMVSGDMINSRVSFLENLLSLNALLNKHPSWEVTPGYYTDSDGNFNIYYGEINLSGLLGSSGQPLTLHDLSLVTNQKLINYINPYFSFVGDFPDTDIAGYLEFVHTYGFSGIYSKTHFHIVDNVANLQLHLDELTTLIAGNQPGPRGISDWNGAFSNVQLTLTDSSPEIKVEASAINFWNIPDSLDTANPTRFALASILHQIQGDYALDIFGKASEINSLLSMWQYFPPTSKFINLEITSLDASMSWFLGGYSGRPRDSVIKSIDLSHAGLSTHTVITESTINSYYSGTTIDIVDGDKSYQIILNGILPKDIFIFEPVDANIVTIQNIVTTAQELTDHLTYYESLAKSGLLGEIQLSDSGIPNLDLTRYLNSGEGAARAQVVSSIKSNFDLTIAATSIKNLDLYLANPAINKINVFVGNVNIDYGSEFGSLATDWNILSKAWNTGRISQVVIYDWQGQIATLSENYSPFYWNSGKSFPTGMPNFDLMTHIQGMGYFVISMEGWGAGYDSFAAKAKLIDSFNFHGTNLQLAVNMVSGDMINSSVSFEENLLSLIALLNEHPGWEVIPDYYLDSFGYLNAYTGEINLSGLLGVSGQPLTLHDLSSITNQKLGNFLNLNNYSFVGNFPDTDIAGYLKFVHTYGFSGIYSKTHFHIVDSVANLQLHLDELTTLIATNQASPSSLLAWNGKFSNVQLTLTDSSPEIKVDASSITFWDVKDYIENINPTRFALASILHQIQENCVLDIVGKASEINGLLTMWQYFPISTRPINLEITSLDSTISFYGPFGSLAIKSIDLSHAGLSTQSIITESSYNNYNFGTTIEIVDGDKSYQIILNAIQPTDFFIIEPIDPSISTVQNIVTTTQELTDHLLHYESLAKAGLLGEIHLTDSGIPNIDLTRYLKSGEVVVSAQVVSSIKSQFDLTISTSSIKNLDLYQANPALNKINVVLGGPNIDYGAEMRSLAASWDILSKSWNEGHISQVVINDWLGNVGHVSYHWGPDFINCGKSIPPGIPNFDLITHIQGMGFFEFSTEGWGTGYDTFAAKARLIDTYDFHGISLMLAVNMVSGDMINSNVSFVENLLSLQALMNEHPNWDVISDFYIDNSSNLNFYSGEIDLSGLLGANGQPLTINDLSFLASITNPKLIGLCPTFVGDFQVTDVSMLSTLAHNLLNCNFKFHIVDTFNHIQQNLETIKQFNISDIKFRDSGVLTINTTVADFQSYQHILRTINSSDVVLNITGSAAEFSAIDFNSLGAKHISIILTDLNGPLNFLGKAENYNYSTKWVLDSIDLSHAGLSSAALINSQPIPNPNFGLYDWIAPYGTLIDILDGNNHYQITINRVPLDEIAIDKPLPANIVTVQNINTSPLEFTQNISYYETLAKNHLLGDVVLGDIYLTDIQQLFGNHPGSWFQMYKEALEFIQAKHSISEAMVNLNAGTLPTHTMIITSSSEIMGRLADLTNLYQSGYLDSVVIKDGGFSNHELFVGDQINLALLSVNTLSGVGINFFDIGDTKLFFDGALAQTLLKNHISIVATQSKPELDISLLDLKGLSKQDLAFLHNFSIISVIDKGLEILKNFNFLDSLANFLDNISINDVSQITVTTNEFNTHNSALISKFSGSKVFNLIDTAENLSLNLDLLNNYLDKVNQIQFIDPINKMVTASNNQIHSDSKVLDLIGNYQLHVNQVKVANLPGLLSNTHVISISIADTADNISAYLDSLVGVSNRITTISILDSSPIVLTESQLHSRVGALALIQGAYTLTVTNVAAKNLIDVLSNSHVTSVSITDTAANISTYFDSIQILSNQIANITLVDNAPISLSESLLTSDAKALLLLQPSYSLTVNSVAAGDLATIFTNTHVSSISVSDTASNLASNLDKIQANLLASKLITGITVNDNAPIYVTESQLTSDVDALGLISGSYSLGVTNATAGNLGNIFSNSHVTSVSITDSTANIAANLDLIEADLIAGKSITGITITDNNPIVLTESQLTKDADALALISGNYRLEVTNVPIADLFTVQNQGQSHLSAYSISISDSVANIVSNFGTLANNYGIIKSITPTDPTTPISLKSTQLSQYSNVVPKLAGDYHLEISGNVSDFRSQAYTLWNLRHPISFTITDSAENLSTNYSSIFWSMVISQVAPTINLTDPSVPININGYQLTYQAHILYYIGGADFSNNGAYLLNVTDATIDQALPWLSSPHLASITILDTSVKISQQLDWLNHLDTQYNNVSSISVTDGQLISINVSQLINDINLLNKINLSSSFLAITDSSDQIASNLDVLQENISKISSITQSGIATPLAITATQLTNDADVLAKLTGNYTLKVSDVLAANVSDILNNTHVTSISITDTAANILANLDALELVNGKFTSITLSDNTPMTLTVAQLIADHDVIAKITNSGAITILDTAINIDTNIAYLHSLGSQITSISIAEKVPTIDWVHQFGLSSTSNSSIVWGLASSGNANGDLFVAGYSWDYANYPASNTTYLSKVDANGNTLWTENLGSSQSIGAEGSVISDIAGNVYIETMGTSGPYLEKLSTNGEMIWKTSQPNLQTNYLTAQVFNALSLDDSGYIYAIGDTYKGLSTIANKGGLDGYLAKYDPVTGAAIWETLIGSSANDQLQSVTTDVLGNVYVSGTTFGNVAAVNSGGSDGFVAKYSSNGVLIWEKQFPSALNTPWGGDRGNAQVLVDGQENVYITGNTTTSVNGQPYSGGTAIYLIKLDANGNTLWTQEFGSGWETFIQSMAFTASGNIAMTGFAYGSLNGQPYQGGYGEWLSIEYGVDGTLHWTKEVGTSSNEASMAIATNSSGKIYIGGFSEGNFYSLNPTNNNIVGYVVALGSSNLELTAQEVSSNSDVLNKVANGYTVAISDTATHVSDNLDALKTISDHISRINFSDINSLVMTAPQTFDGANANTAFNLAPNALGTPSSSNFATINNWQVGDVIQYSSFLKVIGNSGPSSTGLASINAQTGLVTFDPADQTSLQDEIAAVESAIAAAGTPGAGHFAKWDNGGDTYVLVTDNHAGSAAGAGDDLVKLVGVDSYHVQLLAGVVVAH